jgi:ribulose-phosphate 3-epimerase
MIDGLRLSASLMCSSFADLASEFDDLKAARVDELHVDVMDGVFVPNFALGPDFVREVAQLAKRVQLPVEAHLMVKEPGRCISVFEGIGLHRIVFHVEATSNLYRLTEYCRERFPEVFVAINPFTPLSALEYVAEAVCGVEVMTVEPGFAGQRFVPSSGEKIRRVRALLDHVNPRATIEVDGAISAQTVAGIRRAGAGLAVLGGSGLYSHPGGFKEAVDLLERALRIPAGDDIHERD